MITYKEVKRRVFLFPLILIAFGSLISLAEIIFFQEVLIGMLIVITTPSWSGLYYLNLYAETLK